MRSITLCVIFVLIVVATGCTVTEGDLYRSSNALYRFSHDMDHVQTQLEVNRLQQETRWLQQNQGVGTVQRLQESKARANGKW